MSRFMLRMAAAAVAVAGLQSVASAADWPRSRKATTKSHGGVTEYLSKAFDPCWPQRYSAVARQEVLTPFAQQALNGHVINLTIWNYHFEPGTDKLTAAGVEKLDSLVRVRPTPDNKVYIQTARDLAANVETVDKLHADRMALDLKRANVVAKFLAAEPQRLPFEIYVHDPSDPSISSIGAGNAWRAQMQGYRGGISGGGGANAQGAGGGQATSGSTGTTQTAPQ